MNPADSSIYRLRKDNKILGYKKKIYSSFYYSKDLYGWGGEEITGYNIQDFCTNLKDKNDYTIFEEDLLQIETDAGEKLLLHIVYDQQVESFMFFDFQTRELTYKSLEDFQEKYNKSDIQRLSHAFLN